MRQSLWVIALLAACSGGGSSTPTARQPTFAPPGGTYTSDQHVTLASTTPGAVIRYTLDDTAPTATSTVYAEPIDVSTRTTIKAFASATGYRDSPVSTATYVIDASAQPAAAPTFDPAPGRYATAQSVALASTTAGAIIHYTVDGSTPGPGSPTYAARIAVATTTTVKAYATATGFTDSDVVSATYTISGGGTGFAAVCADVMAGELTLMKDCWHANPEFLAAANPFFQNACAQLQAEITAGRVVYDPTGAAACRDALAALTCAALEGDTFPAACNGLLQGQVAAGQACHDDVDCASGWCDTGAACPGVCRAFTQAGQDCTAIGSVACAPGLVCGGTPTETCQAPSSTVGASCPCGAGLWCDASVGGGNTCKAKQTSGACDPSNGEQCAIGYVCAGQTTTTCQPQVGLGGSCATDPFLCGYGYACQSGACVSGPKVGDACSTFGFCIGGYCDPVAQTCKAFKAVGAACTQFWECQSLDCSTGMCGPMFCG